MAGSSPQKPYSKTKYIILSYLVHFIVRVWYLFVRNRELIVPAASQRLINSGGGFIIAVFHETTLSLYRHAVVYLQKKKKASMFALVSQSKDGEIIHQTFARSNLRSVRGSSTRGGTGAFRAILKEMKSGGVPIFTVDGPKGPRHEVKPGVIATASITGIPILFLDSQYDRAWRFNSWDRHFFPKFGANLYISYGEPFFVPKALDEAGMEEWSKKLEEKMKEKRKELEEYVREKHPNNSIDSAP
ncbi:lysophospholipid acyltransferase family protein [Leptospira sp. 'Mane']|uniref:lysophospholipid acyltransferase family protein n=1 Tax=Leptospira sp. 'Mane' TaxID=3387407 RepID=UPI00398B94E5